MKKNVLLLAIAQGMLVTSNSLLIASSPLVGSALTSIKSLATLPLALLFAGIVLTSFPASAIMQLFGRKTGFLIGTAFSLAGATSASFAVWHQSFILFCSSLFLIGIGNGFAIYYRFAAIESANIDFKHKAISYVLAGGIIAALLGPNLANWTKNLLDSPEFHASYISLILVYSISLLSLSLLTPIPAHKPDGNQRGRHLLKIARQPLFFVAAFSAAVGYGTMSLLMTATPLAMHAHNHNFSATAFVISWHIVGMFAPSFFTGAVITRFGPTKVIITGALLGLLCVAINFLGSSTTHFWAAMFLLGISWNFMFVGGTSLLTLSYSEAEKAKTQAFNDFLVFIVLTFTTLFAGILHHSVGWIVINYAVIPFYLLTLLLTLLFHDTHKRNNNLKTEATQVEEKVC